MPDPGRAPNGSGAACRICGAPVTAAFTTADRNRRQSSEPFHYSRCTGCQTLSLVNVPADLSAFYPPDYYGVPASRGQLLAIGRFAEAAKLSLVQRFVPKGRLLEVGPAIGAFLAVAQEAGYEAHAVEMDPDCCAFLEGELGVSTIRSDDPATALADAGSCDVIALWQVIEHLADPRDVVAAAAAALAPGGVLAIAAPNPESLQMRLLGARWAHVDAPRHLHLLPIDTMARLGAEYGLEVVLETTDDVSARGWNLFGWRESVIAMSPHRALAPVLRFAGSVLTVLAMPLERRGRRGATYTMLLRRPAGDQSSSRSSGARAANLPPHSRI